MKKRILAVILTAALCTMMGATALAANPSSSTGSSSSSSSSSSSHSSRGGSASNDPATVGTANTNEVSVAIPAPDGTVSSVNLTAFTEHIGATAVTAAATAAATGSTTPGEAVSAMMTTPASEIFKATINALGGRIKTVNVGGYKVIATAPGPAGTTVASVGKVHRVTKYAFVILTAVNADGTVEIVEGVVDPVTLHVVGVFKGTPTVITANVIVPA